LYVVQYYFRNRLTACVGSHSFSSVRRLTNHLLQAAVWMLATFISVSRVTDRMHHATDVAAGAAIGVATAFWTVSESIEAGRRFGFPLGRIRLLLMRLSSNQARRDAWLKKLGCDARRVASPNWCI
jgi:PAP2 superfamily